MIRTQLKGLVAMLGAVALAGCATNRDVGLAPGIEVASLSELPAPTGGDPYTVGRQETLEIAVAGSDMLSGTFLTDEAGVLAYPLIGDLSVAGRTPGEIARMIADRLEGQYIVNPQVRVRPAAMPNPSVSIGGEVSRPGNYPAATSQSLLRAVNDAGGLSDYAKVDDVLVLRTVDGQKYIGVYNIRAIQRGNYPDPTLYPGDIVFVGDSPARRRFDAFLRYFSVFSTGVVLLDRTTS